MAGALARTAVLVDIPLAACFPERIGARIYRVGEHVVHLVIGGSDPLNLRTLKAPEWKLNALPAQPQPHLARRAQLGEPLKDRCDRAVHGLVGIEQHVAVLLAPHKPDRQPAAQLAALGRVTLGVLQAHAHHVQLGLGELTLDAELSVSRV